MQSPSASHVLIQRFQLGDPQAFEPLFELYRPRLALLIHYKMGPQLRGMVEVDDVMQETMMRACRQMDQFEYRRPGSFLHWISRIAEHVIVDEARFHGREKRQAGAAVPLRSDSNPQGAEPADSRTPSRIFSQNESLQRLLQALESLPDSYRQVILLSKIEGLGTGEVAERLGKSREAVAVMLHRALRHLRRSLEASRQK